MKFPRLILVTDRLRSQLPLIHAVESALSAIPKHSAAILLREKDLEGGLLFSLADEMRAVTVKFDAPLLISSRVDIALAAGADGVHLGGDAPPIEIVRPLVGNRLLLGASLHGSDVAPAEADYAFISPIFATQSKPGVAPLGLDGLSREVARAGSVPLFALGGINSAERVTKVLEHGAAGAAVRGAVLTSNDPGTHVRALFEAVSLHDAVAR